MSMTIEEAKEEEEEERERTPPSFLHLKCTNRARANDDATWLQSVGSARISPLLATT